MYCPRCGDGVKTRTIRFSVEDHTVDMVQCKKCWLPIKTSYTVEEPDPGPDRYTTQEAIDAFNQLLGVTVDDDKKKS